MSINNILHRNFPNILSLFRILMSPFFVFLMLGNDPYYKVLSFVLVLSLSLTDVLDGYYARKYNLISKVGKYLDPFADKVFVFTVLFTLHFLLKFYIPLWMIIVIVIRDISVTFLRNIFEKNNFEFKTSRLAKNKTLVQIISIHIIIFFMIVSEYNIYPVNYLILYYIMLFSTLLTLFSGFDYYYQYYLLRKNESN